MSSIESQISQAVEHLGNGQYKQATTKFFKAYKISTNEKRVTSQLKSEIIVGHCYSFVMVLDDIEKIKDKQFLRQDSTVREQIDILISRYEDKHFPLFLKLQYLFKKELWTETINLCSEIRKFLESKKVNFSIKGQFLSTEQIPELDLDYCKELLPIIEQASLFGLMEKIVKMKPLDSKKPVGANWTQLRSDEFNKDLIKHLKSCVTPISPLDLHIVLHTKVLPNFCCIKPHIENQTSMYFNREFINQCDECLSAKARYNEGHNIKKWLNIPKLASMKNDGSTNDVCDNIHSTEGKLLNITMKSKYCQTDKVNNDSKCVQTNFDKENTISVQTEKTIGKVEEDTYSQIDISKNSRELSENNNFIAENIQLKEAITKLKNDKKLLLKKFDGYSNMMSQNYSTLQKLLMANIDDKRILYEKILDRLENNCKLIVKYMSELESFCTPYTLPTAPAIREYIQRWEHQCIKQQNKNKEFQEFYRNLIFRMIQQNRYVFDAWPKIAEIPIHDLFWVFDCLKQNLIKSSIDERERISNPYFPPGPKAHQNKVFLQSSNIVGPAISFIPVPPQHHNLPYLRTNIPPQPILNGTDIHHNTKRCNEQKNTNSVENKPSNVSSSKNEIDGGANTKKPTKAESTLNTASTSQQADQNTQDRNKTREDLLAILKQQLNNLDLEHLITLMLNITQK